MIKEHDPFLYLILEMVNITLQTKANLFNVFKINNIASEVSANNVLSSCQKTLLMT